MLGVSRSGYYHWIATEKADQTEKEKQREKVKQTIRQYFHESYGTYGARRIHADLKEAGYKVSERTVGRYMKHMGLRATPMESYTITTDSTHHEPIYDNLLKQNFEVERPNQVWVSDLTYIWSGEGWVYLAIVLDLYSRKMVGWCAADHMQKELPLIALKMALTSRKPDKELIVHSDRGSQYASKEYREALEGVGALGSMSRTGNPYDNACAETFFATLKKELIYRRDFPKRAEVVAAVNWYIGCFYNEKRRHSHNDQLSPNQFERGEAKRESTSSLLVG